MTDKKTKSSDGHSPTTLSRQAGVVKLRLVKPLESKTSAAPLAKPYTSKLASRLAQWADELDRQIEELAKI